ncbi:MAG TPA: universal stress protein [Solirubrobacter sp.]|nr:universal stress protein [Solirubrobacter sp.]
MPAPIIAAYSPYTEDRAPVALALAAAELSDSEVTAVAVYPWTMTEGFAAPYAFDGETQQLVTSALQRLHEDLGVKTEVVNDLSIPRALHALAREVGAGLIVVGSTGRGRAGRVLAGSTAERLLVGAPCPVLLAPRALEDRRLTTIAVGFVDTPEGHDALAAAHALAAHAGARLRVIAVLHPSGGLDAAMAAGLRPQRAAMLEGRHRQAIETALDQALAALPPGVDVERDLHVDDPAEVLLRISEHVDLLVCGSRGYGPLRSVLLGGVSRRLVDEARCPVLVLPREAGRPLEGLFETDDAVPAS